MLLGKLGWANAASLARWRYEIARLTGVRRFPISALSRLPREMLGLVSVQGAVGPSTRQLPWAVESNPGRSATTAFGVLTHWLCGTATAVRESRPKTTAGFLRRSVGLKHAAWKKAPDQG